MGLNDEIQIRKQNEHFNFSSWVVKTYNEQYGSISDITLQIKQLKQKIIYLEQKLNTMQTK